MQYGQRHSMEVLLVVLVLSINRALGNNCNVEKLDAASLHTCGDKGYAMMCNNSGLHQVPKSYPLPLEPNIKPPLCLLNLRRNTFHTLENGSFANITNLNSTDVLWLYLDNCNITHIQPDAFVNLTRLLYLNLTANNLTWPDSFGKGLFKPLLSLENLNIKENKITTFNGLGNEMNCLKNIKGLYIDLCSNCMFGSGFANLTNLVTLSLSGHSINACNATTVPNNTFVGVPGLKHLWLAKCNIKSIEANAFGPLENLSLLDLSYNEELTFAGMNTALYGLKNSSNLKILKVNRIQSLYGHGKKLQVSHIENLKTLRGLETLHMDLNKIEVFEKGIFYPNYQLPRTLKNLTMCGNRLTYGKYCNYIHNSTNITFLDISRQHLNYDPLLNTHYGPENVDITEYYPSEIVDETVSRDNSNCSCDDDGVICVPPYLRIVRWRKSFIYYRFDEDITICGANNLIHLDLSFNLITRWNSSIKGLGNLTHLDLSENYCSEASPCFFDSFHSLLNLNISGNLLRKSFDPAANSERSARMFGQLKNLTKLDMSHNNIKRLSEKLFENVTNLQYLNISRNVLSDWKSSMENIQCLKLLDLSENKLNDLPVDLTTYLDSLINHSCNVTLILHSNPLECTCNTSLFLKWLSETKVHVKLTEADVCSVNGMKMKLTSDEDLKNIMRILEKECYNNEWLIASACSVGAFVLSIVVCLMVYRNRWKLRYIYYSRHRRHIHKGFEHLFEQDAFISYAKSNSSFINNCMIPFLEGQHDLKLWIADRNSIPGTSLAENITHSIYSSRKSVLLIDAEYLKDAWCDYEMNMALMESIQAKRKLIILVLMENIPKENLPLHVLRVFDSECSVEYPRNSEEMDTFWAHLTDEIIS